jgi:hypothetical protein
VTGIVGLVANAVAPMGKLVLAKLSWPRDVVWVVWLQVVIGEVEKQL